MSALNGKRTLIPMNNPYFLKGYKLGRVWFFHGGVEVLVDDAYFIQNIANFCEKGLHNQPEYLSEHIGFLMGMLSGTLIPED